MTFDVAPELSRERAPSRNAQKGFSYNLNAWVQLRTNEIERAKRAIHSSAVSCNHRLDSTCSATIHDFAHDEPSLATWRRQRFNSGSLEQA